MVRAAMIFAYLTPLVAGGLILLILGLCRSSADADRQAEEAFQQRECESRRHGL